MNEQAQLLVILQPNTPLNAPLAMLFSPPKMAELQALAVLQEPLPTNEYNPHDMLHIPFTMVE
jgi:hypothetical protein